MSNSIQQKITDLSENLDAIQNECQQCRQKNWRLTNSDANRLYTKVEECRKKLYELPKSVQYSSEGKHLIKKFSETNFEVRFNAQSICVQMMTIFMLSLGNEDTVEEIIEETASTNCYPIPKASQL